MRIPVLAIAAAIVLGSLVSGAPARYRSGPLPALPAMVLGGGEVFLEVAVDRAGLVIAIAPLRSTVPFTSLMIDAVNQWVFVPAEEPSDKGKVTASSQSARRRHFQASGILRPDARRAAGGRGPSQ